MAISEHLNQQKLQEILRAVLIRGQNSESIEAIDLVEDIKQQIVKTTENMK